MNFYFDLGGPEADDELLFFYYPDPEEFKVGQGEAETEAQRNASAWKQLKPGVTLRSLWDKEELFTEMLKKDDGEEWMEIRLFATTKEDYERRLRDEQRRNSATNPVSSVF